MRLSSKYRHFHHQLKRGSGSGSALHDYEGLKFEMMPPIYQAKFTLLRAAELSPRDARSASSSLNTCSLTGMLYTQSVL